MPSIRVRLIFERPMVKSPEQCWMLVDKSSCKLVRDLEYLIVKKFFVAGHTVLNLYIDNFLLPSQEKIDVIRENDIIRVIEEQNHVLNNEKSRKISSKEKSRMSKKRKLDDSGSKRKIKKAKHSLSKKADESNTEDSTSGTEKKAISQSDSRSTKNSLATKEKQSNSENKTTMKKFNSKPEIKTKKKKLKKQQKGQSKDKISAAERLNGFWDKLLKSHKTPNSPMPVPVVTNVGEKVGVNLPQTLNEETMENQILGEVQQKSEHALSKKDVEKQVMPKSLQNGMTPAGQGNHIRFDNDDDPVSNTPNVLNNAINLPPLHPRVLSIRGAATPTAKGTPNLSPIEPNVRNSFPANTSKADKTKQRKGKGDKRKDCYSNKSIVLESTRVGKETEDTATVSNPAAAKDFTVYPLLHGPPRVGDTVAYKMIELSQSYTPEISRYKEGKVLSFDVASQHLKLKLTKASLVRVKGDGRVSSKFELFEHNEADGQQPDAEAISDEVEIQWTSMIEPRLIGDPVNGVVTV